MQPPERNPAPFLTRAVRSDRLLARRVVRAVRPRLEPLEERLAPAVVEWDGGAGTTSWADAANWVGDSLPRAEDDVVIGPAFQGVTITSALSQTVKSVTSDASLLITGNTFQVEGVLSVAAPAQLTLRGFSPTLRGATIAAGTSLWATWGTLDGVTIDGALRMDRTDDNCIVTVRNGLTLNGTAQLGTPARSSDLIFAGTQTLGGTGTVVFGANPNNDIRARNLAGAATLTVAAGITIRGHSGVLSPEGADGAVVLHGTLRADVSGGTVVFNPGSQAPFTSPAALQAVNGGTLALSPGRWILPAGLEVTDASQIRLSGSWDAMPLRASGGGTISVSGANNAGRASTWTAEAGSTITINSLNNTGGTLTLAGAGTFNGSSVANTGGLVVHTGTGRFNNGSITGGTVEAAEVWGSGSLNGVTVRGNLRLDGGSGVQNLVNVYNGLTLDGTAYLGGTTSSGILNFIGTQTFVGTATVVFGPSPSNGIYVTQPAGSGPSTLTLAETVVVRGQSGSIMPQAFAASITNAGTIRADVAGGSIVLHKANSFGLFINQGTLLAVNGGSLTLEDAASALGGALRAVGTGSTLSLAATYSFAAGATAFADQGGVITFGGQVTGQQPVTLAGGGGTYLLTAGSAATPLQVELASQDRGDTPEGFANNLALGSLRLIGGYTRLTDTLDTIPGSPEALYVGAIDIRSAATLDLNGLPAYTRSLANQGSVIGGSLVVRPDGGPLPFNTRTPGGLSTASEVDEWTFFGRTGQSVAVTVEPGASGSPAPLPPTLDWAAVQLLAPDGSLVAGGASAAAGGTVLLTPLTLPADGTYRLRVRAPADRPSQQGNYHVGVWDAGARERPLVLGQTHVAELYSPYEKHRWTFSAAANTQVRFRLSASATTSTRFALYGPAGFVGFSNLGGDSPLVNLPADGTYSVEATSGGATGAYAFRLEPTGLTDLPLGVDTPAVWTGSGVARLFRLHVPAGQQLLVRLDDPAGGDRNELYLRHGAPPTRETFDHASLEAAAGQQVLVPMATPGDWYVLAYGTTVPVATTISVRADAAPLVLLGATPTRHGNASDARMTLAGAGFLPGSSVQLVAGDGTLYPLADLSVESITRVHAVVPAGAVPAGVYGVRVTRPDAVQAELPGAYTVVEGGQAILRTNLVVPNPVGFHQPATVWVEYSNTGDLAMPAPLLLVTATQRELPGAFLTLDATRLTTGLYTSSPPDGFSESVQILASGATAGLLLPGESVRVPVYYAGWRQDRWDFTRPPIVFSLGVLDDTNPTPIPWPALKDGLRPAGFRPDAWEGVFANLIGQLGNTWGAFVQNLSQAAGYLGRLGERVTDIGQLWTFAVMQASGLGPVNEVGTAVDAAVPAPGSGLSFARSFSPSLAGRYRPGRLGRGWSDSWDLEVAVAGDGTVEVLGPAGARRRFQPDSRPGGRYFAGAGDHGRLRAVGGGFQLEETDGTVLTFRPDGRLDSIQDSNGNRITAGYTDGRLTALTHSSGASLTLTYNAAGRVASVLDPVGRETTYTYDAAGEHLLEVTTFDGRTTTYSYDSGGPRRDHALLSVGHPDGTHLFLRYDDRGRLAGMERDGGAEAVVITSSGQGQVTLTDAVGGETLLFYDQRGLLVRRTNPLGQSVQLGYDGDYNLTRVTDAAGQVTTHQFDSRGNRTGTTDPLGHTTTFTYTDPANRLTSVTDANGHTTRYLYDGKYNLEATVYADGTVERLAHDPLGEVTQSTNRRGRAITYLRDPAGRVTRKTYQDGSQVDYGYDARGNLTSTTDAGGTTTLAYDAFDRLRRITYPGGRYLEYDLDTAGRRTRMIDQDGFIVGYHYDAAGRLQRLTDSTGATTVAYDYDAAGRLARKDHANGTYTTYVHDLAGQLLHLVNHAPDGGVNSRFDYTYDDLGRRATTSTPDGTWTYSYDATGQLSRAALDSTNPAIADRDEQYFYDAVGNRTRTILNGVTTEYASNRLNGYTRVGGVVYTADADGNAAARTDGPLTTLLTYDDEDRLVTVSAPGRSLLYQYDAFGNRVAVTNNGQRTEYVIDPAGLGNVVGEYGPGGAIARYTHGLGLVSRTDAAGTATYDFDALGSTVGMTTAAGGYANRYAYTPFGETLAATRTVANPFTFVGQSGVMADPSGLHYMRARYYFAPVGRFINQDPIGIAGGINLYAYVGNMPTQLIDPAGLQAGPPLVSPSASFGFPTQPGYYPGTSAFNPLPQIPIEGPIPGGIDTGSTVAWSKPGFISTALLVRLNVIITGFSIGWSLGHLLGLDKLPNPVADSIGTGLGQFIDGTPWLRDILWGPRPSVRDASGYIHTVDPYVRGAVWWSKNGSSTAVTSTDPNDKHGPAGYQGFVAAGETLSYRINFENHPDATAPAQRVTVTDPLADDLDLDTLTLDTFGFGDLVVQVPAGRQHYQTTIDLDGDRPLQVQVELWLDRPTRQLIALFQTIDPATGLPPDVLRGFLPAEDGTGRGQGHLTFSVRPRAGLPGGTTLRNIATIVFDANPAITTDQIDPLDASKGIDVNRQARNVLDAGAPTSTVAPLPDWTLSPTFVVSWSGADDPGGSGVAGYDVYVSTDGGPFARWLAGTADTSASFAGVTGRRYAFYAVATDHVGHTQPTPSAAQAGTLVVGPALTLRRNGDDVELVEDAGGAVIRRQSLSATTPFVVPGDDRDNTLTIDLASGGTFTLPAGSRFDAGAGTDRLVARHDGNMRASATTLSIGLFQFGHAGLEQVHLTGGPGANHLDASLFPGAATLDGGAGNDVLRGGRGNDVLTGGPGNDVLLGNGGLDTLVEAADANLTLTDRRFFGGTALGVDRLFGIERASLTGGAGNNVLNASTFTRGPVTLDGGPGNDLLLGGWRNDLLGGGPGADRLLGGRGVDTVVGSGDGSFVLGPSGLTIDGVTDTLSGVEVARLTGGGGDDTFTVSAWRGRAALAGGGGSDGVVLTRGGRVTLADAELRLSATNRFTLVDIDRATLTGGPGNDRFIVSGWTGAAALDGAGGLDTLEAENDASFTLTDARLTRSTGGVFTHTNIERVVLLGGAGDNTLDASAFTRGPVVLVGGPGADSLLGGAGRDLLIGGLGLDALDGGGADDLLIGGRTAHDGNRAALDALMAEWGRAAVAYTVRIRHLKGQATGGLNGGYKLRTTPAATVFTDGVANRLTGGDGLDWFWAFPGETVLDPHTGGPEVRSP